MSDPIKHHFIPKLFLRNFCDVDEKIWMHLKEKPPIHISIDNIAFQNDLYAYTKSGNKNLDNELLLSQIESVATPILSKIIKDVSLANLSPAEKEDFSAFIILLSERNPQNFELVDMMMKDLFARELKDKYQNFTDQEIQSIYDNALSEHPELADVSLETAKKWIIDGPKREHINFSHSHGLESMWMAAKECTAFLLKRDWKLLTLANDGDSFLLSDDPVLLLFADDEGVTMAKGGWGRKSLEIVVPLSPKIAFYAHYGLGEISTQLNSSELDFINELSVAQSIRYILSDKQNICTGVIRQS